jgi:hypothetical protein
MSRVIRKKIKNIREIRNRKLEKKKKQNEIECLELENLECLEDRHVIFRFTMCRFCREEEKMPRIPFGAHMCGQGNVLYTNGLA